MFYDRLTLACKTKGLKITPLVQELNLSAGNIDRWKKGGVPSADVLLLFADKLDVTVDYLLENDNNEQKEKPAVVTDSELIDKFKSLPLELQIKALEYAKFIEKTEKGSERRDNP